MNEHNARMDEGLITMVNVVMTEIQCSGKRNQQATEKELPNAADIYDAMRKHPETTNVMEITGWSIYPWNGHVTRDPDEMPELDDLGSKPLKKQGSGIQRHLPIYSGKLVASQLHHASRGRQVGFPCTCSSRAETRRRAMANNDNPKGHTTESRIDHSLERRSSHAYVCGWTGRSPGPVPHRA